LKRITLRGSIVGTRRDLDEAIAFAAEGKVKAEITKAPLGDINAIFARLKAGKIDGRMVLDLTSSDTASARKTEAPSVMEAAGV
ncbi:zinc-dependent alcohol dehydrogenase, partial [Mesorhizobium sp. M2E.F.Ca.ET.154.01.1.1]